MRPVPIRPSTRGATAHVNLRGKRGSRHARLSRYFLGVLLALTTGCATVLGGTSQLLTVNSNVEGAEVFLNDTRLGVTPLTADVKRGQTGELRVTADGYQPYNIALNKKISTLFWVNILSGGSFGSTTDYFTGAMYEYEPSTYMVSLQPPQIGLEERRNWMRREALRGFVLLNNEAIVSDLANGEGEHLNLLFDVLSVAESKDRAEAVDRWRAGYAESNTAVEFAELILAELSS